MTVFWICISVLCVEIIFDKPIAKTIRWVKRRG